MSNRSREGTLAHKGMKRRCGSQRGTWERKRVRYVSKKKEDRGPYSDEEREKGEGLARSNAGEKGVPLGTFAGETINSAKERGRRNGDLRPQPAREEKK